MLRKRLDLFLIALVLLFSGGGLVVASSVGAVDILNPICSGNNDTGTNASNTDVCKQDAGSKTGSTNQILAGFDIAITIMAFVTGFAAVIMIILAGITFATSGGDPQNVARARSMVIYALIGIVIAAMAGSIVAFGLSKIG